MISGLTVGGGEGRHFGVGRSCVVSPVAASVSTSVFLGGKRLSFTERLPLIDRLLRMLKLNQFLFLTCFVPPICDDSLIHVSRRPAHVMTMKAAPEVNLGCDLSVVAGVGLKAHVAVRWRAVGVCRC